MVERAEFPRDGRRRLSIKDKVYKDNKKEEMKTYSRDFWGGDEKDLDS